ncbi:glycoside hydrolase family 9 protein [Larkinella rosea]|uniref:T9SS C-terminal target domain-containing protein n=1 Tax=Larkinella rosea TaxID=2025312 RepID=A0A3P1BJ28_9BACT|nr:glycoside hydrolase family 9 protein [Larkinella rosea]RRB01137.1 T9SS C-terminal target domain-containing protein [Larkinella rosea]
MKKENRLFRSRIWHSLQWLLAGWLLISTAEAQSISKQIIVDQFGWRPSAKKIVVFANPVNGQNNGLAYTPGSQFQIRRSSDNGTVFTGNVTIWNNGNLHTDSGDKAWHGDFSSLTTPGAYYVFDPANNLRSYEFEVRDDIYANALKASTRTFYYQRSGTSIPAQYGGNWTHGPAHMQDANALLYSSSAQTGTPRNVTGGWYDAGDYNKYIPFLNHTMWNLMVGYELRPSAFPDNTNIPESGNGVPDLLDELKWELDWMLRMQAENGGVHNRVSVTSYENGSDDPATDTQARYYTPITTWSTATFAAIMAHAARLYGNYAGQYPGYVNTLRTASEKAWAYLEATPGMQPASGKDGASMAAADAGSDSNDDKRRRVAAAAELFATTGTAKYKSYFEANYNDIGGTSENGFHPFANDYLDASLGWELSRAYYVYAKTAGANPTLVSAIKSKFQNTMDWFIESYYNQKSDPYLGMMWSGHYTWGSNLQKALWAMLPILSVELGVNPTKSTVYKEIAEEYLHYFHGRNPLSWTYLSNMGSRGANAGAENSVDEFYHSWFRDGSARYDGAGSQFGPPPGFVVGGPNQYYTGSASPPKNQPPMKAYRNWNTSYPEPSWEITEPAIYNQAGYTFLVAYFTSPGGTTEPPVISATSNSPVCSGQTVNLLVTNAPAGASFRWSGPSGFSSTAANPTIPNATTLASGTYSLTVTPSGGTAQTVSTIVTVNPVPTATASSNTPVTAGQSLNLTAANAGNGAAYDWKGPNAFTSNLQNPSISNATTSASGTYTLTVGLNGCSATATTVVSVTGTNPVPDPSSLIIYEDALQTGWVDWSWNMTRNYNATSPVYSGSKSLSVQNTVGWGALYLHAETPVSLSTYPKLTFWVHGGPNAGQRMQVVINSSGGFEFTPQANQWTLVTVPFSAFGNPATLRDIFIQDVTNRSQPAAYIDQLQLVSAGGTTPPPTPTVSASSNSPICANQPLNLSATVSNMGTGATYNWKGPNGFTASVQNPTLTNAVSGTYQLTVLSNGNSYTANTAVTVKPLPTAMATSNSPVSAGQSVNLTAANAGTGSTYSWSGPDGFAASAQNPTIANATPAASGVYSLTVNLNSCTSTATTSVTVTGGTTEPAPGGLLIYDDALKTGWRDWSWSVTRNYNNGTPVKAGSKSLALQYTAGWGGLYLHPDTPVNLASYSQLQFWVHGGPAGGQQFKVTFNASSQGYTVRPTANAWTLISIPLASLGSPATLNDLYFQDTGGAINSAFYVDNLQLSALSPARLATAEPDGQPVVRVYPNPVGRQQGVVTLSFSGFQANETVEVRLADPHGRIIRQRSLILTPAEHAFPIGQLVPGTYLLSVQGPTTRATKKIVVD